MKASKVRLFFTALLISTTVSGCQSAPQKVASPWAVPFYFSTLPFSIDAVLPQPPADGSAADKNDLRVLKEWQKKRTEIQCEAGHLQETPKLRVLFGRMEVGDKGLPDFSKLEPEKMDALKTFYTRFQRDISFVSMEAKEHFSKKRPSIRTADIQPCIKRETSFSYPSGHAAQGAAGAVLLSELFPENSVALKKAGVQAGLNRIIGGVHYPSDVEAGVVLGEKAFEALLTLPEFKNDLMNLKKVLQP